MFMYFVMVHTPRLVSGFPLFVRILSKADTLIRYLGVIYFVQHIANKGWCGDKSYNRVTTA